MKKFLAIVAAGVLALPSVASASVFGCNGCTPGQMYEEAWRNLYSPGVQPGYVVNLANGTVAKYANIANIPDPYDPEPPPYEPNIIAMPVEPAIASLIYELHVLTNGNTLVVTDTSAPSALHAPKASSAAQTSSGGGLPANPYESALNPALELSVAEKVALATQAITFAIAERSAALAEYRHFYFDANFPMEVTFVFREGGSSRYRYDRTNNRWIYIANSARDVHGNRVPDKKEDVDDENYVWNFTGSTGATDIDWFRWLVESFGIPVIDMRPTLSGGGGIVCVDNVCYIQIF